MNKFRCHLMLLLTFIIFISEIKAQTVIIETTQLQIVDKKLEISYNFIKSKKNQRFDVWVDINNQKGIPINARTLSGDIGANLTGGAAKKIVWDYNADGLVLDEEVEVFVNSKITTVAGAVSTGKCFTRSLLMPGMGLSTIEKDKPFWIIGVVGYASLGTALYLNSSYQSTYNKYLEETDQTERKDLYDKSISQKNMSKVFLYTAIGTWSISLIWTVAKARGYNNSLTSNAAKRRFDFYTQFDPINKKPLLGIKYIF
jgi:hypothetical protein